jgi:hypothetical protein
LHTPTIDPAQLLRTWLTSLRAGEPQVMDALALVPLYTDSSPPPFDYVTLAEAHARGQVVVSAYSVWASSPRVWAHQ